MFWYGYSNDSMIGFVMTSGPSVGGYTSWDPDLLRKGLPPQALHHPGSRRGEYLASIRGRGRTARY